MAQPWPGKASAVAGNFYKLPDGKIRLYAGGDEFRVAGTDSQGITRVDLGGLLSQFGRGLMPQGGPRPYGATPMMHDFGGLPSRASAAPSGLTKEQQKALIEGPEGATARVARIKAESDALVDAARKDPNHQYHNLFQQAPVILSDDASARESALTAMRQQYAPGSQFFDTDAGKAMIQSAKVNEYTGDQAGLPEYYANQAKVGTGAMPEIIEMMGFTGDLKKWAEANPALALREYNKKFGGPAEYAGTGPSDEEIKAAMAAGQFSPAAGSPNPLGETGMARESNTAGTAAAQPVDQQRKLNLDEIQRYMDSGVPGLNGKQMLGEAIKKKVALTPTQLRNDPFLR